jgi:cobalt-zinc-cadmium efflux system outer membrane protein
VIRKCLTAWLFLMVVVTSSTRAQSPAGPPLTSRQLTLAQAEEILRVRNLAVVASRHQLDASRAGRLVAGFKPNPVLTLGAQQIPITSNVPGSVPRLLSTNSDAGANPVLTAHVDKIIERGGKREFRIEQADGVVDATMAEIEDTLRTQRFLLRQAFVAALLARDNLRLAGQLQDQYAQTVKLTATRVQAGALAPVELFRIQSAGLPFEQGVLDAQNTYDQATRDVLNLLDVAPGDIPALAANPAQAALEAGPGLNVESPQTVSADSFLATAPLEIEGTFSSQIVTLPLADLRALALTNRPDIQVARGTLRAATSAGRLAEAQRTRDVVAGVEYQRVGNDQAVGMTLQVPLFVYNNQRAGVAQAAAQEKAADAQLRQAEEQALTDVDKAYQTYLSATRTLALYNDANLRQVEDVRRVTEYSYGRGAVSLLELLEAERMARQTLISYNQARAAYQLALFGLEQAIGAPLP